MAAEKRGITLVKKGFEGIASAGKREEKDGESEAA